MDAILIQLLFVSLLTLGIGAYIIGKNKQIDLLKAMGLRSSLIMFLMIIIYTWMSIKSEYTN